MIEWFRNLGDGEKITLSLAVGGAIWGAIVFMYKRFSAAVALRFQPHIAWTESVVRAAEIKPEWRDGLECDLHAPVLLYTFQNNTGRHVYDLQLRIRYPGALFVGPSSIWTADDQGYLADNSSLWIGKTHEAHATMLVFNPKDTFSIWMIVDRFPKIPSEVEQETLSIPLVRKKELARHN